jgi:IclR family pca regulon transcriptional regulator
MSGADIAAITGLSRAAARRCLHTLQVLGYASSRNGAFELTPAVLALSQAYLDTSSIASAAQPILERVSERLQESSAVAVMDGEEIVFVARAATRRILSVEIAVGSRLPAACTASGRVLLAFGPAEIRWRFMSHVTLTARTSRTIVDKKALRAEIDRVRLQGYAIVDQELELGLRSAAVPVRRHDGVVVAALNVGVRAGRVDARTIQREFVPILQEAADHIGRSAR